jgi:hypothetical protein
MMTMTTQPLLFDPGTPAPRQPRGRRALDERLRRPAGREVAVERAPTARLTRGTGGPEIVNEPGGVEHPALVLRCLSINYRAGMVAG